MTELRPSRRQVLAAIASLPVLASACASSRKGSPSSGSPAADPTSTGLQDLNLTFSINVQDFAYPELSADVMDRIVDLHVELGVPVDVFLTDEIARQYEDLAPGLVDRLRTSPLVAVSYHARPPVPYYHDFDWAGLSSLPTDEQEAVVREYETHRTDLTTGESSDEPGGYAWVAELIGYEPYSAGALADAPLKGAVDRVFAELGAPFTIEHGRPIDLGERTRSDALFLKPEHYDLLLFTHVGEDPAAVYETAASTASGGAAGPAFVGVKMHDNDFFAVDSAWVTTYGRDRTPPWDLSRRSDLLTGDDQTGMWDTYESFLRHVAEQGDGVGRVNLRDVAGAL
ncbi:MAG: hypothetical protein ACT4PI_18450 [Actinomycetota bacterium]